MVRPRICRCLCFKPPVRYFKPRGIPLADLEEIDLMADELEALKLHDVDGLKQIEAAKRMKISQPTFARTLDQAYKKIAQALIDGKAIKLKKRV